LNIEQKKMEFLLPIIGGVLTSIRKEEDKGEK
jgi:hypothetical protein